MLWQQGETVVLATASVEQGAPPWRRDDQPGGWVTADYVMLPGSTPGRKRWPKSGGHTDSRGTEIERLVGRSLRAGVDLSKIGPHTVTVDCHILKADGGTRTASICAGWVALADALASLPEMLRDPTDADAAAYDPAGALLGQIAAVSVGLIDGVPTLDLDYPLDSRAGVDLNVVRNAAGRYVEIQGTAEGQKGYTDEELAQMLTLAADGCEQLMAAQSKALSEPAGGD